jgi:diacylglycerol kinase (ATP)
VALIVNPVSGGGLGRVKLRELMGILKSRHINFEVMQTLNPGHGAELGRQVKNSAFDCLLVLGGDGTMSEVAKGLFGSPIPVATIPCGSGNDLAGTLGIPRDLEQAMDIIAKGNVITIDLFRDEGVLFTETIGCGFAAEVVSAVVKLSRFFHGPVAYLAGVFDVLSRFKSAHYKIQIDDTVWEGEASLVLINNSWRVGGGMKITPNAVLNDGWLDIAIFTATSKVTLLSILPRVYSGSHVNSPHIIITRGKHFVVEAERELIKMADGDIVGTLPIKVEIVPQSMNFFCAKR